MGIVSCNSGFRGKPGVGFKQVIKNDRLATTTRAGMYYYCTVLYRGCNIVCTVRTVQDWSHTARLSVFTLQLIDFVPTCGGENPTA
jgi:hypothetical protein